MTFGKKFDVVLMNPPYDNGLHEKVLQKTLNISDTILSVQPISWLIGKKQNKRITSLINDCYVNISNIDGVKHFSARLETEMAICHIDLTKDKKVIYNDNVIDSIENVRMFSKDKYLIEFNNLIEDLYKKDNVNGHIRDVGKHGKYDTDKFVIRISLFVRGYRLFTPDTKMGTYKELVKLTSNKASVQGDTSYMKMYLSFDDKTTMNNAYNYLRTDFVNSCLLLSKNNMHLDRGEMKTIPWFDFSDSIFSKSPKEIDDYLFEKYNISDDIRKHIEEILPDYYNIR